MTWFEQSDRLVISFVNMLSPSFPLALSTFQLELFSAAGELLTGSIRMTWISAGFVTAIVGISSGVVPADTSTTDLFQGGVSPVPHLLSLATQACCLRMMSERVLHAFLQSNCSYC